MRIVIHNFGPIKEADIETKRYTVFIGQTSTGKSVAAKLISIANAPDFLMLTNADYDGFIKLLTKYNIDFIFNDNTEITIIREQASWIIRKNSFKMQGQLDNFWSKMNGDDDFDIKAQRTAESFLNKEDLNDVSESQLKMLYLLTTRMVIKNMSPVYIPAERILISLFTNNIFSLLQIDSSIPESIKRFGSLYEDAKSSWTILSQIDLRMMQSLLSCS